MQRDSSTSEEVHLQLFEQILNHLAEEPPWNEFSDEAQPLSPAAKAAIEWAMFCERGQAVFANRFADLFHARPPFLREKVNAFTHIALVRLLWTEEGGCIVNREPVPDVQAFLERLIAAIRNARPLSQFDEEVIRSEWGRNHGAILGVSGQ
jgi:hypothetical protein